MGVPDKLRGEVVRAIIQLKPGEKATKHQIRRFCTGYMADYKCPKQIVFSNITRTRQHNRVQEHINSLLRSPRQGHAKM